ncbi:MAG: hypothetical protein ACJA0P_001979 [Planctomycetota bacterium]|jgi:hypothetical protein
MKLTSRGSLSELIGESKGRWGYGHKGALG